MFGRFNESKTKFMAAYEAQEGAGPTDYKVIEHSPPLEDGDVYLRAAKAHELAVGDFENRDHLNLSYNVLRSAGTVRWLVRIFYSSPERRRCAALRGRCSVHSVGQWRNDQRKKTGCNKTLLESSTDKPLLGIHTNVLSDTLEDSDVFYAITLNAAQGDWVVTKKYAYSVSSTGSISYLAGTEEAVRMLQNGQFPAVIEASTAPWSWPIYKA